VSDDDEIRDLITGWIAAVRSCDLEGALARHDPDIVMFDVPPPFRGVRGIDEYRQSWGPFFEWLGQGAMFELVDLDVVAGTDVAFAYALLRCGMPADFDTEPDNRLRVTVGLCKRDGRWIVTHEHHSFPMA
jgi:uncharacterized protein (TIGR02246 family)